MLMDSTLHQLLPRPLSKATVPDGSIIDFVWMPAVGQWHVSTRALTASLCPIANSLCHKEIYCYQGGIQCPTLCLAVSCLHVRRARGILCPDPMLEFPCSPLSKVTSNNLLHPNTTSLHNFVESRHQLSTGTLSIQVTYLLTRQCSRVLHSRAPTMDNSQA